MAVGLDPGKGSLVVGRAVEVSKADGCRVEWSDAVWESRRVYRTERMALWAGHREVIK